MSGIVRIRMLGESWKNEPVMVAVGIVLANSGDDILAIILEDL